ncbi:hypothetical protein MJD09_20750, partial [bacterium]|nr:hypothetical protein [bacterium]
MVYNSNRRNLIREKGICSAIVPIVLSCSCVGSDNYDSVDFVFRDVTSNVKLDFIHDPAIDGNYFMPESIGSGGAFLDFDNDGDLDIYLLNGAHRSSSRDSKATLRNRLYRQEDGGT